MNKDPDYHGGINTNEINDNNNDESDDEDKAMFQPFPTDPSEMPGQTLELVKWFRKMANPDDKALVIFDEEELSLDAKEFLFPCAQDEYTLSEGLKPEDSNDFLEGKPERIICM